MVGLCCPAWGMQKDVWHHLAARVAAFTLLTDIPLGLKLVHAQTWTGFIACGQARYMPVPPPDGVLQRVPPTVPADAASWRQAGFCASAQVPSSDT